MGTGDGMDEAKIGELADIFRKYRFAVLEAARSRGAVGMDAEDVCSEVFAKAILKYRMGDFEAIGTGWEGWLRVSARNLAIDYGRRNARLAKRGLGTSAFREDASDHILASVVDESDSTGILEAKKAVVQKAIEGLSVEHREVVVMHLWGNLKFREIADLLGISVNTAVGRWRYAMTALRKDKDVLRLRCD
jgi:RNA polymerase sigma-70 factor (ECF subfamily)